MLFILSILALLPQLFAARYDPLQVQFNLNQNQSATNPLDYWGEWSNHTYNPSPSNWRFPFYTFFLDRYALI
jgi:alpha-1,3-glucan synthase